MDLSVFADNNDVAFKATSTYQPPASKFRTTALQLQRTFSCLEEVSYLSCLQSGSLHRRRHNMVSATDLRYATKDAFFAFEINIGMTADVGTLQRMPVWYRRGGTGVGLQVATCPLQRQETVSSMKFMKTKTLWTTPFSKSPKK